MISSEVVDKAIRFDTILSKAVQLLAYSDDMNITGRNKRNITAALNTIESEIADMDLVVKEDKTE